VKRESREIRGEVSPIKEEAPRSVRRRTTKSRESKESKESKEDTEDKEPEPTYAAYFPTRVGVSHSSRRANKSTRDESDVPVQTPTRALAEVAVQLPPSPAVVTEVIDRQTTEWSKSISEFWNNSGVQELSDSLRTTLSSVRAVEVIITFLEAIGVLNEALPRRHLTTLPPIDALHSPALPIKIPDLFVLVDSSFWAPVSLWLLTSVFLPLTVAYFFNISLQVAQSSGGPASRTHRSSSSRNPQADFDPLSFNIAKALLAYLVYAHGFTFWNIYSEVSVQTVNASIPFQYAGILTGAAIGVVGTIYEAILRK
jgi:hypothetical protein